MREKPKEYEKRGKNDGFPKQKQKQGRFTPDEKKSSE